MPVKVLKRKPVKKLKSKVVAEYFNKIKEEKERLISLLADLVPDSLPDEFLAHLETTVLPQLLVNRQYSNYFPIKAFGFTDNKHLEKEIKLLQKAWKGMINISLTELKNNTLAEWIAFDPVL